MKPLYNLLIVTLLGHASTETVFRRVKHVLHMRETCLCMDDIE